MSLPIDLTGKQGIIGGNLNSWGQKINANELELADGINEIYEMLYMITGIDGGKANSVYTPIQKVNGGGA